MKKQRLMPSWITGWKNVPSYLLDPIAVNKDNIDDTIIKDGFHTKDAIYKYPIDLS